MDPSIPVPLIVAVLFLSTLTRSTLGFGDSLLAMPLLALIIEVKTATPLVAFVASTIALTILLQSWQKVDVRAAWRLVVSSFVGLPLGLLLVKVVPESYVTALLGVILILFGLYRLTMPKLPAARRREFVYMAGFVAGVFGGAYNLNGPPVIIYGALRRWSPERFRATLQGFFLPSGLSIVVGHGLTGLWTPTVFRLYAYALPVILLAIFLGERLNRRIKPGYFDRVVYAVLVVMGILLLV